MPEDQTQLHPYIQDAYKEYKESIDPWFGPHIIDIQTFTKIFWAGYNVGYMKGAVDEYNS